MRNKYERNQKKIQKYKKRVKLHASGLDIYIKRDGTRIYNPKSIDIINDKGFLFLKTTSTPCSCWMCAFNKYDRSKQKEENYKLIKNFFNKND